MWLRVAYRDLAAVQADAMDEPAFRDAVDQGPESGRWRMYLAKALAGVDVAHGGAFSSTLLMIRVCGWAIERHGPSGAVPVLFAERRPWQRAIARYASASGVLVVPVPGRLHLRDWLRRHAAPELRGLLREARVRWQMRRGSRRTAAPGHREPAPAPRVCVE